VPLVLDRAGELLRDERQYVAILLTIADIRGVALNNQNSEDPVGSLRRTPIPIQRGAPINSTSPCLDQRVKRASEYKARFAGAEDVFSETAAELFGLWPRICFRRRSRES